MKIGLYWNYATRSLIRNGQRTVLGIFCIAVGVMAIVAVQLVGQSINHAFTDNIAAINGGDLRVSAPNGQPFTPLDLSYFDQQKSNGKIAEYASSTSAQALSTSQDGSVNLYSIVGVSAAFPLVAQPNFTNPTGTRSLHDVLTGDNVAINQQVLSDIGAHLGDTIHVQTGDGRTFNVKIAAVFSNTGAYQSGQQMYINIDTLESVAGPNGVLPKQYDTLYATLPSGGDANAVKNAITQQFPNATITTVADELKSRQDLVKNFQLFLQIVGLIALFIGGIGIINTMQVLLRRRTTEIAMLKTSGYRQSDLYSMFGVEAALLGFMGGVIGAGIGVGASYFVSFAIGKAFNLSLPIAFNAGTFAFGVFIGLATALIFGLLPIVQASQVRPLSVLRENVERSNSTWLITGVLLALLSVLFVALATTILGDLGTAVVAVYGGAIVLLGLAGGFGLLVLAISKLPVYEKPTARILLWVLLGLGGAIGGILAFALLGAIGSLISTVFKSSGFGVYGLALFGGTGLVLLGGSLVFFLATIVDVIVMFLPRTAKSAVMLAYRNMGRQRVRTTTTLTALFVGVFAISLVLVLGQGIKDNLNTALANLSTRNVFIYAPPSQANTIGADLNTQPGVTQHDTLTNLVAQPVDPVSVHGQDVQAIIDADPLKGYFNGSKQIGKEGIHTFLGDVVGYNLSSGSSTDIPDVTSSNAPKLLSGRNLTSADAGTDNVVVDSLLRYTPLNLQLGDTIVLRQHSDNPTTAAMKTLAIVGFFDGSSFGSSSQGTIWGDTSAAQAIGGPYLQAVVQAKVDPNHIKALRKHLGETAPSAVLISLTDIGGIINNVFTNLINMLLAVSSLVLVSGLIIIANAVALAMLERRREIGILKSVGHTSGSVLATVLIENGLVGLLGALVAILLVGGTITLLSLFVFKTPLSSGITLMAVIIGSTTLVTMFIAGLVAWDAARVRPLEVLRYE